MIVCAKCKVEMRCKKTGSYIRFGPIGSHAYPADQYECTECGATVNVNVGKSVPEFLPSTRPEDLINDVWMG